MAYEPMRPTSTATCLPSLITALGSINREWQRRWRGENPGICFRGCDSTSFDLNPSLLRAPYPTVRAELAKIENNLWLDVRLRARHLLGRPVANGWEALLIMQQHGFPTRLLDWSRTLAVAAHFAVRDLDESDDGAVWVLAARGLMELRGCDAAWTAIGDPAVEPLGLRENDLNLDDFCDQIPAPVRPDGLVPRLIVQRSVYTLHTFQRDSLHELADRDREQHHAACFLHKIVIPSRAKDGFRSALPIITGVTEETLFPDLDGLARDFVGEWRRKQRD